MNNTQNSNSAVQTSAEEVLLPLIENRLGLKLEQRRILSLQNHSRTCIHPDFYSEEAHILGEIFSHIGKPKKAQNNKIANDILKMLVYEKLSGIPHRKILVVCDEEEYKSLRGFSVLAEAIRQYQVELLYIEISEELRSQLLSAQKRQRMVNA